VRSRGGLISRSGVRSHVGSRGSMAGHGVGLRGLRGPQKVTGGGFAHADDAEAGQPMKPAEVEQLQRECEMLALDACLLWRSFDEAAHGKSASIGRVGTDPDARALREISQDDRWAVDELVSTVKSLDKTFDHNRAVAQARFFADLADHVVEQHRKMGDEPCKIIARYLNLDEGQLEPHMEWLMGLLEAQHLMRTVPLQEATHLGQLEAQVSRGIAQAMGFVVDALTTVHGAVEQAAVLEALEAVRMRAVPGMALVGGRIAYFGEDSLRPPVSVEAFLEAILCEAGWTSPPAASPPPAAPVALPRVASQSPPPPVEEPTLRELAAATGEVLVNPQFPMILPEGSAHKPIPASNGRSLPGDLFAQQRRQQHAQMVERARLGGMAASYGDSDRTGLATPIVKTREISFEEHSRLAHTINPYNPPDYHVITPSIKRLPPTISDSPGSPESSSPSIRRSPLGSRLGSRRSSLHLHSPSNSHSQCQQHLGMQDAMSPNRVMNNPVVTKLSRSQEANRSPPPTSAPKLSGIPQRLTPVTPPFINDKHRNWPLQDNKVWNTDLLSEYVSKSRNQLSINPAGASFPGGATFPMGAPPRKSLLEVAGAGEEITLPEHIQRLHGIEQRIHHAQAKQLSSMEEKLAHDEARLRARIERRLDEVETRLHVALSEDRKRWQKKAQHMTVREGYHQNRAKMKSSFNAKPTQSSLVDPMLSATNVYGRTPYAAP